MAFTKTIRETQYSIISKEGSGVLTLGDIDGKTIGFLEEDFIIDILPSKYSNIKYSTRLYSDTPSAVKALENNEVSAFITSGGETIFSYLLENNELNHVADIVNIKSEMSLGALKQNEILISILNKFIIANEKTLINDLIKKSSVEYIRSILKLTTKELTWIVNDGVITFGVTKDYLPFDWMDGTKYAGISGKLVEQVVNMLGLNARYYYSDFEDLFDRLKNGGIDVLNAAKTEEREKLILFTMPYILERDKIFGLTKSQEVFDIYGLEGKRVAVIKGFYQSDLLKKNLIDPILIEVNDIKEALDYIHTGKADYIIENSLVISYYTEEMGIYDVVEKGNSSTDTFLYFAVNKDKPEIASILNKIIPILNIQKAIQEGIDSTPRKKSDANYYIFFIVIGILTLFIGFVCFILYFIFNLTLKEQVEKAISKQREEILYTDSLTGLHNRNYFNAKIRPVIDEMVFPQAIISFDLNKLKEINETYGYYSGDLVLESFGQLLNSYFVDYYALRINGDEFVVFVFGEKALDAEKMVERLEVICSHEKIKLPSGEVIMYNVAIGHAIRIDKDLTIDELFKQADDKMYDDKKYKKSTQYNI